MKEGNRESRKITQPGSTNRSEHSSRDMTHIAQSSFNQSATGRGKRESEGGTGEI